MWAKIISRSSCGSSLAYVREMEVSGSPRLNALFILALLRYQTMLPGSSIPLEPSWSGGILTHSHFSTYL